MVGNVAMPGHRTASPRTDEQPRQNKASQQEAQQAAEDYDASPAAGLRRFVESSDEMSALQSQFRQRQKYDLKGNVQADEYGRVLDEDVVPKVEQILKLLKTAGISSQALLHELRRYFTDDSDLVLVLRQLLKQPALDETLRGSLEGLLQQVEQQADPKPLRAGINCALKARLFGKALEVSPGLLRACYRQFVQSEAPPVENYADWIGSFGHGRRALVLDFIESSVMADIHSLDPSCSHPEFGYLLGRLGELKLLRSADILFIDRLGTLSRHLAMNVSEADWLTLLVGVLQQPETVEAALGELIEQTPLENSRQRGSLLQGIFRAFQALPDQLFQEEHQQHALLDALRQLLGENWQNERHERRHEMNELSTSAAQRNDQLC